MINAQELEPEGCTCSHCWCDCYACEPVTDWYSIPGGWVTDRNILLREDLIDGFEKTPTVIPTKPKGITALLEAEPADKITRAHFAGRYLDAIEAEGLRIVPATDTVTEVEWDAVANRFHLIMQGTERIGFLMPLRHPDPGLQSRTPKAAA
jgi:hypothetical protein